MKKHACLAFLLLAPITVTQLQAAGFDCAKASTEVEKIICANPQLSTFDEQLGKLYQAASKTAALKKAQQHWLRTQRDTCHDDTCLSKAYQQRIAELSTPTEKAWTLFTDKQLGIAFSYPAQRKISPQCHDSKNCVALLEPAMPSQTDYLIAFEIFDGNLDQIAVDKAIFTKNGQNWIAQGRSGEYPAELIQGDGWQGIKAVVDCGVSDENGFHAAAGECLWAVLSNGKRSVVIDTQGLAGNDDLSLRTIQSIRFLN
ncbi:MAG: hypothetical protein CTY16_01480 [Methylobacter sp.]|nr:MAG: hypothetical protein CTY16_01480 [Methylobacter sp.]